MLHTITECDIIIGVHQVKMSCFSNKLTKFFFSHLLKLKQKNVFSI